MHSQQAANIAFATAFTGGQVYLPGTPEYDSVQPYWLPYLMHENHPMVVVANTIDAVRYTIEFARIMEYKIVLTGSTHGTPIVNDAHTIILMIQLRGQIIVDTDSEQVWVPAGTTWGELTQVTASQGYIGPHGNSPQIQVTGNYTFYGGIGTCVRHLGFCADSMNEIEVVTSNGDRLRASHAENSDLFWAFCGGGGNFGAVTGLSLKLSKLKEIEEVRIQIALQSQQQAEDSLREFSNWMRGMPLEMTALWALERENSQIVIQFFWCGDRKHLEGFISHWRTNYPYPISACSIRPFYNAFNEQAKKTEKPQRSASTMCGGQLFNVLPDPLITTIVSHGLNPCLSSIVVRCIGYEARSQVNPISNSITFRDCNFALSYFGQTGTEQEAEQFFAGHSSIDSEVLPYTAGHYCSFTLPDLIPTIYQRATGKNYHHLQRLHQKYGHIFRGGGMPLNNN